MLKKNKKIVVLATIAVVLILIGIVALFLTSRSNPDNSTTTGLTLNDLFEENRKYFAELESIDVSVNVYQQSDITEKDKTISNSVNFMVNTQKKYLSNSAVASAIRTVKSGETETTIKQTAYIVNENGTTDIYTKQIYNMVDNGWRINSISKSLKQIMGAEDFYLIEGYERVLKLEDDIVDVDGVKCYKVTGKINNIKKIADHYDITKWLGFYNELFASYANVTLYFREDTHILHSYTYDFTEYWMDEFNALSANEGKTLTGTLTVNVVYNDFNSVDEIIVDEKIKDVAVEALKDPFNSPIDLENELYVLSINSTAFEFGSVLGQYSTGYTLTPLVTDENAQYNEAGAVMIAPNEVILCSVADNDGNSFIVGAINNTEVNVPYTECVLNKVNIRDDCAIFNKFVLGQKITCTSSLKDCRNILGACNMYEEFDDTILATWRSYIDYADIQIEIDVNTGEIIDVSVFCFNLEKYLQNNAK